MKGKKISHVIGLHTFLSACGGILLAIVLFLSFLSLEEDQQKINNDIVVLKDVLRMEQTYREWLVMMDLLLGNDQVYLARGTQRQAHFFVNIIQQLQEKHLPDTVKKNLQEIIVRMREPITLLTIILNGENVQSQAINQFDNQSLIIIDILSQITIAIQSQVQKNGQKATLQRKKIILQSILAAVIFIVLMVIQWLFLSVYLVRPVQKLNNAVSLARKEGHQFYYLNESGTIEIKELAENSRIFINNLEEKIIARTDSYKAERDKAMAAAEIKTNFLSLMNHELRTPLNAIMGFSQLLDFGSLTPDQKNYQQEIINASNRLLKLLNRIFELIKIEEDDYQLNLSAISANTILLDVIESLSEACHTQKILLKVDIQQKEMLLLSNTQCLSDIFTSLIRNAIKYSHKNGCVEITCHQENEHLFFSVKDHGVGIKPAIIKTIFEPFVDRQADFVDGLGISLFVTKRFIELMEGNIGVDSTAGKGSYFYFRIPIFQEPR
jgi:signal transduction histidine kinase